MNSRPHFYKKILILLSMISRGIYVRGWFTLWNEDHDKAYKITNYLQKTLLSWKFSTSKLKRIFSRLILVVTEICFLILVSLTEIMSNTLFLRRWSRSSKIFLNKIHQYEMRRGICVSRTFKVKFDICKNICACLFSVYNIFIRSWTNIFNIYRAKSSTSINFLIFYLFYWVLKNLFLKKGCVRIYGRFSTCQFKLGCVRVNTNRKKVKYICKEWHFSQIYIRREEDISIFHLSIIFIRNIFNWSLEILCSIGRIMNRERKENGTLLFCI